MIVGINIRQEEDMFMSFLKKPTIKLACYLTEEICLYSHKKILH